MIAEQTGYAERTIREYLDEKYKETKFDRYKFKEKIKGEDVLSSSPKGKRDRLETVSSVSDLDSQLAVEARALTILTREPHGDDDRRFHKDDKGDEFKGTEPAPRTDKYAEEAGRLRSQADGKSRGITNDTPSLKDYGLTRVPEEGAPEGFHGELRIKIRTGEGVFARLATQVTGNRSLPDNVVRLKDTPYSEAPNKDKEKASNASSCITCIPDPGVAGGV